MKQVQRTAGVEHGALRAEARRIGGLAWVQLGKIVRHGGRLPALAGARRKMDIEANN